MTNCLKAAFAAALLLAGTSAQAAVIGTNGSESEIAGALSGSFAEIIAAPANVNEDAAFNNAIQAFNEAQNVLLGADLTVDGGIIAAGTLVSSHMIFLNSGPGNDKTLIEHGFGSSPAAKFTFDGDILGVMSDSNGALELASNFLGAAGTIYPVGTLSARGMEGNPLSGFNDDYYSFFGNEITVGMRVTEPGDWIRVVTVSAVPVPASVLFLGSGLAAIGAMGARRRRKAT